MPERAGSRADQAVAETVVGRSAGPLRSGLVSAAGVGSRADGPLESTIRPQVLSLFVGGGGTGGSGGVGGVAGAGFGGRGNGSNGSIVITVNP
jgi:hypothetical protein